MPRFGSVDSYHSYSHVNDSPVTQPSESSPVKDGPTAPASPAASVSRTPTLRTAALPSSVDTGGTRHATSSHRIGADPLRLRGGGNESHSSYLSYQEDQRTAHIQNIRGQIQQARGQWQQADNALQNQQRRVEQIRRTQDNLRLGEGASGSHSAPSAHELSSAEYELSRLQDSERERKSALDRLEGYLQHIENGGWQIGPH